MSDGKHCLESTDDTWLFHTVAARTRKVEEKRFVRVHCHIWMPFLSASCGSIDLL